MYLFLDTETTGTNLAKDRVVQVAWIVASDNGQIEQEREYIIRPDGFYIPTRVSEIHGITTERAEAEGHSLSKVLKLLHTDAGRIDYVVAHHVSFDLGMLRREFVEVDIKFPFDSSTHICTMMSSVNYCRLQKLNGMSGYKRPTLNELHFNLFKKYFDGAHNAMSDTQACMRCFFELKRLGVILLSGQSSLTPRATIISSTQSREAGRAERDRTEEDRLRRDRAYDAKQIAEYKSHMARQNAALDRANKIAEYIKAAEQGNALAQLNLGAMYDYGREGVPKDDQQAVVWYRKAAEQGNAGAQFSLGRMYANGRGVPKDDQQAVVWYRKAAEQGDTYAQSRLGEQYVLGLGVPKDEQSAYFWLLLASERGDHSVEERDIVKRGLSPEQRAAAEASARNWQPARPEPPPALGYKPISAGLDQFSTW